MRRPLTALTVGLLLASALSTSAWAVPAQLNHQGRLSDLAGAPLAGVHNLTFNVYTGAVGGSPVFTETITVDMVDGYYSVQLGADALGNPLSDTVLQNPNLYLGLSVDGGAELAQRVRVSSVPYARLAGTATSLEGGVVDATEIQVGGTTVIDATGTYVGPGGTDTLASLSCFADEVAVYDGVDWVCQPLPSGDWNSLLNIPPGFADDIDDDALMSLVCADGQLVKYDTGLGMWDCADDLDTQLTDSEVLAIISNNPVTLHPATTIAWGAVTAKPSGFSDNIDDDTFATFTCPDGQVIQYAGGVAACSVITSSTDTLAGLSCADGEVAKYDAGTSSWVCAADDDATRTDAEIIAVIENNVITLNPGTTIDWANVSNKPAGFADGIDNDTDTDTFADFSCLDGEVITYTGGVAGCAPMSDSLADLGLLCNDGDIPRWDDTNLQWDCSLDAVLTAVEVLGIVDGADLTLGPNSTLNGAEISTGPHYTDADAIAAVIGAGGIDESVMPFNGLNEVSNGLITNQFVNTFEALNVPIPDNNPIGVASTIAVPSIGIAEWLLVHVDIDNSDISGLRVELVDPMGNLHVLYDGADLGTSLTATYPVPTAPISGDLTTWEGLDPSGDWTLEVTDSKFLNNAIDGEVVRWAVEFQHVSSLQVQVAGSLEVDADLWVMGNLYGGIASFTDITTNTLTVNSGAVIDGGLQLGDDTSTCDATKDGTLRWNSNELQVCDGTAWIPAAPKRGAIYTRWGRTTCPGTATTVYTGYAASGHYSHYGGISSLECLHDSPTWGEYNDGNHNGALFYGTEFQTSGYGLASEVGNHDYDARCVVCLQEEADHQIVVPGSTVCPSGWNVEYTGNVMANHYTHPANNEMACVDVDAEATGSNSDSNGNLWYPTETECGSLPCPPYVQDREVSCVVCTK